MMRRQVRVLTSEGRLSAWVLALMPIAIGLYMFATNRDYIMLLFTTKIGIVDADRGAALLLLAGSPVDEEDRGHRCLSSGSSSQSDVSSSRSCWSDSRSTRPPRRRSAPSGSWSHRSGFVVLGRFHRPPRTRDVSELRRSRAGPFRRRSRPRREAGHAPRRPGPGRQEVAVGRKPAGVGCRRVIAFKVIGAGVGFVGGAILGIGALHLRGLPMLVVVALLGSRGSSYRTPWSPAASPIGRRRSWARCPTRSTC